MFPIKKKNENFKITIVIKNSDWEGFNKCLEQISKLIEKSLQIPSHLILKFFSFIQIENQILDEIAKQKATDLLPIAKEYYKSHPSYEFEIPHFSFYLLPSTEKYTLYDFISTALYSYFLEGKINDKDEAITFFRSELDKHIAFHLMGKPQFLSNYKKDAITAYLALLVGYKLNTQSRITNESLFQAARNSRKKKKMKAK